MICGFEQWGWLMAFLGFGILITAAYGIRTIKYLFTGPEKAEMQAVQDLRPTEVLAATVLIVGILVFGFYPTPILDMISHNVDQFVQLTQIKG
jgi:NADH-quinone oxidoreductase subunit M